MADVGSQIQPETAKVDEQKLKFLEFVHIAALRAVLYFTSLYGYAKEKSGPLKPGVENVEERVKTVISPLYQKVQDVPIELLKFVDRKVDESVTELNRLLPPVVKKVSISAFAAAHKAPEVARSMVSEVQLRRVFDTASGLAKSAYTKYEPTAKGLYSKYEPVAEQYAVSTWHAVNRLPLFPQVAQVVLPTASHYAEKYNQTLRSSSDEYKVLSFLPLVPTEKIAKVFGESKPSPGEGEATASAQ